MSYAKITACFLAMPVLVIVVFFAGWMLAAGCSRAHIFVANESRMPLSNLVVSGACKERRADALAPLAEWRTVTPYRSGGLIHLSFVGAGSNYFASPDMDTNHSGHCGITFRVDSNMVVRSGVKY